MKQQLLFVNGNLSVGGTERSLINLLNSIDMSKYDIDLILYQPGRELAGDLNSNIRIIDIDITSSYGPIKDVIIRSLKTFNWRDLILRLSYKFPHKTRKLLFKSISSKLGVRKKYDVAIAYRPEIAEEIVLNCVSASKKFTWWHHGSISNNFQLSRLIYNWQYFDKIVTVSESIAYYLQQKIPVCSGKTEIVYNTINPLELINKSSAPLEIEKYSSNPLKLITVSRLSHEKNLEMIVEISKELYNRGINFKWTIIGNGPQHEDLRLLIESSGLEERIDLHGETDNPYPWMRNADLMVHPSLVESFGLVLIEAMAVGTPCVAAKSLGAQDVINNTNGLLVENNPIDFADAILELYSNQSHLELLSRSCIESITKYSSDKVTHTFYHLITSD